MNLQADDILFVPLSGVRMAAQETMQAGISAATGIAVIAAPPVSAADGNIYAASSVFGSSRRCNRLSRTRIYFLRGLTTRKLADNVFPAAPPEIAGQFRIRGKIADGVDQRSGSPARLPGRHERPPESHALARLRQGSPDAHTT